MRIFAICTLLFVFSISGCTSIKEAGKGFAGISTKELEAGRKSAIVKTFDYDYFTSFTKALDTLKNMGSYIYAKDIKKHMIAVYASELDTTPVGVFFKEISQTSTQVEVSSLSTYAKETISQEIFQALGVKSPSIEEKKGEANEKK
jgi:hypothetical protein